MLIPKSCIFVFNFFYQFKISVIIFLHFAILIKLSTIDREKKSIIFALTPPDFYQFSLS